MLKHVVVFKFTENASEQAIAELEKGLKGLPAAIPAIKEFQVGRDIMHGERSYDLILISAFDDVAALKSYQVHPAHLAVVELVKKVSSTRVAVDFEY